VKVADSTGVECTGGTLLMRSLIFRRLLLRDVLAEDERFVGVLLPPSVGAVLANAALALCRRVTVNLNFTVTSDILNYCIRESGIRHVLTSRRFMEKMNFDVDANLVYLEDLKETVRLSDKLAGAVGAFVTPVWWLERRLGLTAIAPGDLLTLIFTSGSTGQPKGVMLSYDNVGSNARAIDEVVHLRTDDTLLGLLPFFHSFGYTVTLWTVLTLAPKGVYHYSPLDAKVIGKLCREHRGTILLSTPTFLRGYIKRVEPEEFRTLDVVVAGAEKLPQDVSDGFEKRFGTRPVEGYGTTELSPLVSVNVPASRSRAKAGVVERREGSVGRPVPGVRARIVHPETGEVLPTGAPGMLQIGGPNVMLGYLNQPGPTAEVVRDGWYTTGDLAYLDADGFIFITGRESRFSKIGGEMVPHILVEEAINRVLGAGDEEMAAAVTAVPDERKGERLVVLHRKLDRSPGEVCRKLAEQGLPNLWVPGTDSFMEVAEIPVLGTGKLDLKRMRELAMERIAPQEAAAAR
jgi:acyl-[acyl-carrier-protein]-phospholipid O-acyltransferase/long-chain-fatty-acid--[acyl-carrier-protein] ligase